MHFAYSLLFVKNRIIHHAKSLVHVVFWEKVYLEDFPLILPVIFRGGPSNPWHPPLSDRKDSSQDVYKVPSRSRRRVVFCEMRPHAFINHHKALLSVYFTNTNVCLLTVSRYECRHSLLDAFIWVGIFGFWAGSLWHWREVLGLDADTGLLFLH